MPAPRCRHAEAVLRSSILRLLKAKVGSLFVAILILPTPLATTSRRIRPVKRSLVRCLRGRLQRRPFLVGPQAASLRIFHRQEPAACGPTVKKGAALSDGPF